ncbi:1,4-beta-xylanase [Jeotgalibacillus sp. ET6]|uniref:glycoside hydrolase family 113 n=1 Tax=Jeotgalibacillus sp. ET6 TaxID=3037260 RepID=UPI0024189AB3|nr:1,4-beta-xylanase [Jeotgalibacillus sp. ET6]MDG5471534.1 1,4-beta-xylanase [Jeotgalibacillus sp. ET6]
MDFIKGFTFGWDSSKGDFRKEEAKESLRLMKERTGSETVILSLAALQDTAHSTEIDFNGPHMVEDEELVEMIQYARTLDLKVILKPTVNTREGTWRAHINFFDLEVPCEPKWSDWFASYTDYQLHYAKIAQKTKCEMLIIGCEMVQTERRENEWRALIGEIRKVYGGPITYNTDKYQEANVSWWDAVDVISSSGYYPITDWDRQLDRIEKIIKPYDKPFFFAEAGCPSRTGSSMIPNDWEFPGGVDLKEQADFYRVMFEKTKDREWVQGFGLWDWNCLLHKEEDAEQDRGYGVYGKPAEKIIKDFYSPAAVAKR